MFSSKKIVAHLAWITLVGIAGTSGAAAPGLQSRIASRDIPGAHIPAPDGLLHVYTLPVGHGYSDVIQCPNGDLALSDMGASAGETGFWGSNEISFFLEGQFHAIKNIIISHYHGDHFGLLPAVLTTSQDLSGLENIYVSCGLSLMPPAIMDWITAIQANDKIRLANGGAPCGPNGISCGTMNLCPGDPSVTVNYMAANMGNCAGNLNVDSIFFKLTHNQVSIIFNGDFEDLTMDPNEDGPQKAMVDYYGDQLKVTIFKVSRHGRSGLSNKAISNVAHSPRAIFVGTFYGNAAFGGPSCNLLNAFANELATLCRPLEMNPANQAFCSEHPRTGSAPADRLQLVYTCVDDVTGEFITVFNNQFAIYTTVPNDSTTNVITLDSDGVRWGFINGIAPRVTSI